MDTKRRRLEKIAREIERCRACKSGKIGRAVPGEGNPDADVMFVGEAPGKTEAVTGRPFVGRSGKFLRFLIRKTGLKENDVFITSPVKYLPKRGTPSARDIAHGMRHLAKQIAVIQPKVIVLLGNVACKGVLGESRQVLKDHGSIVEKNGRKYIVTLHPAAVIRFPKYKHLIESDFKKVRNVMRRYS